MVNKKIKMKQLINEAKRMQQLAGILKEDLSVSPVDTLIDNYLSKFSKTLTPEERAKFKRAIEMDYEEGDISKATVDDAAEIYDASGIRSIEDSEDDDEPRPGFDVPYNPSDENSGKGDLNIGRGRG